MKPVVVYVHGLWLTGLEAFLLQRRVEQATGWSWRAFPYLSTMQSMDDSADGLHAFIAAQQAPVVHLVGHSLGGLVILRCLERHPVQPPGRVVFLGTPAMGSHAAAEFGRLPFGPALLGETAVQELILGGPRRWTHERELGVIAGDQPIALARLVVEFEGANDGAVSVDETRIPGARAHVVLPVSHTGMLLAPRVADEIGAFLATGAFTAAK